MSSNQFYNKKCFMLIKVKISEHSLSRYTYACHTKHNVSVGDWVVVPIGTKDERVFNTSDGYRHTTIAVVTAITSNMNNIPKDFSLKHVISKVNGKKLYNKITRAKSLFQN